MQDQCGHHRNSMISNQIEFKLISWDESRNNSFGKLKTDFQGQMFTLSGKQRSVSWVLQ